MPIFWKSKILLAKIESSYGTDPTPSGADNGVLATNITLRPMEGQDVSRELELPWLGAQATIPAELHSRIQFQVELAPSGTVGVAPAWGPLLRACRAAQSIVADTSVAYTPISTAAESATIWFYLGETRYIMKGCRGNCVMRVTAQGIPYLDFDMMGLFSVPSQQTRPAPTLTGFQKPRLATSAATVVTIDSIDMVTRNFALDLGNDVQGRFLIGSESIQIVAAAESLTAQVEALSLSTWNPYTKAAEQAAVPISVVHDDGAGKIATLAIPAAQVQRPEGLTNAQNVAEWPLRFVPLPTTGNDQWSLTLT